VRKTQIGWQLGIEKQKEWKVPKGIAAKG